VDPAFSYPSCSLFNQERQLYMMELTKGLFGAPYFENSEVTNHGCRTMVGKSYKLWFENQVLQTVYNFKV